MEHRIAIIGTGLIGASIGLALRRSNPGIHICGFDSAVVLETALARGAISEIAESIEEAVSDAEIVIVATPISSVESVFKSMAPFLEVGAIVTDVCSVKCEIRDSARNYLPDYVTFVGGHPMAGSERTGPGHADELLLENATYVLCPPESVSFESFESYFTPLVTLLRSTGARLMLLTAEQHDRIAAVISHVPQLLAVALVNLAGAAAESDSELLALAAGGFRDMTRIASSPFTVWDPILR
ncbi:MAG: prephenate dehydrogenase/arogenate dehydrogenase family protein, partial [Bacteroidetes bacterium]